MRTSFKILLLGSLFTCRGVLPVVAEEQKPAAIEPSLKLESKNDIVYDRGGNVDLKLDLALPATGDGPFPAIICLHGGGWQAGHRASPEMVLLTKLLAQHGFAAVTVSYRLAPKDKYPAQIHDVKAAVRWVRANAKTYKIDPDHIGAIGFSAGGHLVSLLATTDKNDGLEGDGGNREQSSRIQAAVNYFGPTDMTKKDWDQAIEDKFFVPTLGGTFEKQPELYKRFSPASFATKDYPPMLFQHGEKDELVAVRHSRDMAEQLKGLGIESHAEIYAGAGHGWVGNDLFRSLQQSVDFFDKHLKPNVTKQP